MQNASPGFSTDVIVSGADLFSAGYNPGTRQGFPYAGYSTGFARNPRGRIGDPGAMSPFGYGVILLRRSRLMAINPRRTSK